MALDRLNGFMSGYNAYNIPSAKDNLQINVRPDALNTAPENKEEQPGQQLKEKALDLTVEETPVRGNASIENVAISFGQYDSSSLSLWGDIGRASDDMRQAISGMQKDQILHEYQYFVGGKDLSGKESNIIAGTEDGVVVKLN